MAFPVLGAGSGGFDTEKAAATMRDELQKSDAGFQVVIVRFRRS